MLTQTIQETNMLTEVDIERIMAEKRQLAESIVNDADYDTVDDEELFEILDDDSVSEANGLM